MMDDSEFPCDCQNWSSREEKFMSYENEKKAKEAIERRDRAIDMMERTEPTGIVVKSAPRYRLVERSFEEGGGAFMQEHPDGDYIDRGKINFIEKERDEYLRKFQTEYDRNRRLRAWIDTIIQDADMRVERALNTATERDRIVTSLRKKLAETIQEKGDLQAQLDNAASKKKGRKS